MFIVLDDNFVIDPSIVAVTETVPESSSRVTAETAQLMSGASLSLIWTVLTNPSPSWAPVESPVTPVIV